jgi:serine/threonine protein phosphatase PrpC
VAEAPLPARDRKKTSQEERLLAVFGVYDGNSGAAVARLLQDTVVSYTLRQLRRAGGTLASTPPQREPSESEESFIAAGGIPTHAIGRQPRGPARAR